MEFTNDDIVQIDTVENAAFRLGLTLIGNPDEKWNIEWIGKIADAAAEILDRNGFKIHYPAMTEDGMIINR